MEDFETRLADLQRRRLEALQQEARVAPIRTIVKLAWFGLLVATMVKVWL